MAEREWQVGDLAIRTGRDGSLSVSLVVQADRLGGDCWGDHGGGKHWHHSTGAWNQIPDDEKWGTYRPLVVIDPEDREQVERFASVYFGYDYKPSADPKPPKPAEPTGLGAVVEDADGVRFVRAPERDGVVWRGDGHWVYKDWTGIDAVKVLSEGVTP